MPRIIDNLVIQQLRPSIEAALHSKFFSDDKAAIKFMAEDPETTAHREDLEAKSARLLQIAQKLDFSLTAE